MTQPLVSVVVATYDSSHLLRHAVASVLGQDLADSEIRVVGDHCTDDTEAVLASFGDPRIHFTNLPTNSGQQAKPNNVGVAAARGEYLAFLNQDDLWLPGHLSGCLARLEATGADILVRAHAAIPVEAREKLASGELLAIGNGYEPSGSFSPRSFHVASSWFLRRSAAARVGPWRMERETWVTPSQDWLFRAWRRGLRIDYQREISMVAIFSGGRRDSYRVRDDTEHAFVFEHVVASDRLRARVIEQAEAFIDAKLAPAPEPRRLRRFEKGLRRRREDLVAAAFTACGLHPNTGQMIRKWGLRPGSVIRGLKAITG